jgi:hypothetical protein
MEIFRKATRKRAKVMGCPKPGLLNDREINRYAWNR